LIIPLLVYSLVQTEFLVAYMSIWQSMLSQTVVALVEMMSSESYACGGLLNLLIHFLLIFAHGFLLVILYWSPCEDSLLFCKSWHVDGV
jgi:hypothetical protein